MNGWSSIRDYYWRTQNGRGVLFLHLTSSPTGDVYSVPRLTPLELGPLASEDRSRIDAVLRERVGQVTQESNL